MTVIEHNLDVIKTVDWIIDLGPDGGPEGGQIMATGTPETISKDKKSETGLHLSKALSVKTLSVVVRTFMTLAGLVMGRQRNCPLQSTGRKD